MDFKHFFCMTEPRIKSGMYIHGLRRDRLQILVKVFAVDQFWDTSLEVKVTNWRFYKLTGYVR